MVPPRRQTARDRSRTPTPMRPSVSGAESLNSRGLKAGAEVTLFYRVSEEEPRVAVATGTLFGNLETEELLYSRHGKDVRTVQSPFHDVALVYKWEVNRGMEDLEYPYNIHPKKRTLSRRL